MKNLITIIIMLVAVGCGKSLTEEEKKVVGSYGTKKGGDTWKLVFLENGIGKDYKNGKKSKFEIKWKLVNGEIHADKNGFILVLRINKDGNLTEIATIPKDRERIDTPKEDQFTFKKIK